LAGTGDRMTSGLVSHIMRFALHDGPGIRTTVFFKGCPLECWWCHNPETQEFGASMLYTADRCRRCGACVSACVAGALSWREGMPTLTGVCDRCGACADACAAEARIVVGRRMTVAQVIAEVERDVVFFDESGGGVTFSGGEPLSQPRFLEQLLDACRARGVHTVLDTSGYAPTAIAVRLGLKADLIHYDIKFVDEARHAHYTGVSSRRILDNLRALCAAGAAVVVRVPIVPGINDSPDDIDALQQTLAQLPVQRVDLLPYHASAVAKYRRLDWPYRLPTVTPPSTDRMHELAAVLAQSGHHVITGDTV
jgi:pyruvate formate lyase activating enzyme